jgi:hypothetical protein
VYGHKFLRIGPRRFHAISKSKQSVPVQPFGRAFEGVRMPLSVQQITLKTSGRQSNTVRTLCQASPNSTRSWISEADTIWEVFARRSDDMAPRPDAVQHFRIFRASFSNGVKSYGEDRPDTRPSRPDVDLVMEAFSTILER